MNEELYIITFAAGSSGRFLANILYSSLVPEMYINGPDYTKFNSAHKFNPYSTTYVYPVTWDTSKFYHIYSLFQILENLILVNDPAVIAVHARPNFDKLEKKFSNYKLIVITLTENDLIEVVSNSLLKNGFEYFSDEQTQKIKNPAVVFIQNIYKQKYGVSYTGQEIPINERKDFFDKWYNSSANTVRKSYQFNPVIPDKVKDKVMLLPFHDIMTDMPSTLNKISKLINRPISDQSMVLYETYLENRKMMLEKFMPWLNDK